MDADRKQEAAVSETNTVIGVARLSFLHWLSEAQFLQGSAKRARWHLRAVSCVTGKETWTQETQMFEDLIFK